MPFDPNTFPVALTPENLTTFSVGNRVNVPESAATCPLRRGRVVKAQRLKWTILVQIEPIDESDGS